MQDDFRAACSAHVELDSETVDLAQQILKRCHSAILETGTFGLGLPAQVVALRLRLRSTAQCLHRVRPGVITGPND